MTTLTRHYVAAIAVSALTGVLASTDSEAGVITSNRNSADLIVGESQSSAPAEDYYTDTAVDVVGLQGSNGSNTRTNTNIVFGFLLPTLAPGETIDSATFNFEITAVRDQLGNDASLEVYLLDSSDPSSSGITFFYNGAGDTDASVEKIGGTGSTYDSVGNTTVNYADDAEDTSYAITGDALTLLQGFYGGDNTPDQTEAFFRFNLSVDPSLSGNITRYLVDTATDESSLVLTTVPEPGSLALLGIGGLLIARRRRD